MAYQKRTNLQKLLATLKDGQWHPSQELVDNVSWRFGHTVLEARRKGYRIEIRKIAHNQYEYQMPVAQRMG